VAFWVSAAVFVFGAIVVAATMRSIRVAQPGGAGAAEPVAAH
jgi:hypothetical protein